MIRKHRVAYFDAMTLQAEQDVPETLLLLKLGENTYTKGGESGTFEVKPSDAEAVLSDFRERGRELVIDYEHQSLTGEKAPAAGWIDRLSLTPSGICGHVKYWTEEALRLLGAGEYKYYSPTLYFSRSGKKVSSIHSVALTNHPALHNIPALAAADRDAIDRTPDGEVAEDETAEKSDIGAETEKSSALNSGEPELDVEEVLEAFLDLLGTDSSDVLNPEESLQVALDAVKALLDSRRELQSFLREMELQNLREAAERIRSLQEQPPCHAYADRAEPDTERAVPLVEMAFHDGKLAESMRSWAMMFAAGDPDGFRSWQNAAPRIVPANNPFARLGEHADPANKVVPETQSEIYRMLGITQNKINRKES